MSKFIIVQNLKTLRRGPNRGREDEIVFLHKLLKSHLGPPGDQLPMVRPEASAFGPRTEAKVKKFQEVNKIEIGTKDFKDGVVGPRTWKALTETFMMTGIILAAPQLTQKPPTSFWVSRRAKSRSCSRGTGKPAASFRAPHTVGTSRSC
jgi:hypothetical protein